MRMVGFLGFGRFAAGAVVGGILVVTVPPPVACRGVRSGADAAENQREAESWDQSFHQHTPDFYFSNTHSEKRTTVRKGMFAWQVHGELKADSSQAPEKQAQITDEDLGKRAKDFVKLEVGRDKCNLAECFPADRDMQCPDREIRPGGVCFPKTLDSSPGVGEDRAGKSKRTFLGLQRGEEKRGLTGGALALVFLGQNAILRLKSWPAQRGRHAEGFQRRLPWMPWNRRFRGRCCIC